jgi:folate-binding protein YgfZ
MNVDWIDFLKADNAALINDSEILFTDSLQTKTDYITAIPYLGILKITGVDATQFLQGQLTCNINELTKSNSYFAAFCNAKGRAISTLLILKNADSFLLIIPNELIDVVSKKLQMYILRSDVQIQNATNELCLLGITSTNSDLSIDLPDTDFTVNNSAEITIKLPSNNCRYLIISSAKQAINLWTQLTQDKNINIANSTSWNYHDISAGIAWLTLATSEEYIPQMLNIDKLGGISFNKGCYTGQEIIARTHYLGKAKRELFLAECENTAMLDNESKIISDKNQNLSGKIIAFQNNEQNIRLLAVIPSVDAEPKTLQINNLDKTRINIIDFQ